MKTLIITIAALCALSGCGRAYQRGVAEGLAMAGRPQVKVTETPEYLACIATVKRAGARNTELRKALEKKKK